MRELGAGYICCIEHALEDFCGFFDRCTAPWSATTRIRQRPDCQMGQSLVSQVAVPVVLTISITVQYRLFAAVAVQQPVAFLVVGAQIESCGVVVVSFEISISHVAKEFAEFAEFFHGRKLGVNGWIVVAVSHALSCSVLRGIFDASMYRVIDGARSGCP